VRARATGLRPAVPDFRPGPLFRALVQRLDHPGRGPAALGPRSHDDKEVVLSGGEPLLHHNFTSVLENVMLPLLYHPTIPASEREERAMKAIDIVGLADRKNYLSNQLSGGQKQRVAIARSLVTDPDVIFADEPTGNLDSVSGVAVMDALQTLNDEGHTIILVTHEQTTAEHAKRIINVKDGRIISDSDGFKRVFAGSTASLK